MKPRDEPIEVIGIRKGLARPNRVLEELQALARSRGGWAQLLDAARVLGIDHLRSAANHARRAIREGTQAAGSSELEFLLYASGERQIARAIETAGVRPGRPFVAVLSGLGSAGILRRFGWARDDTVIEPGLRKLRKCGFTAREIEAAGIAAHDLALELVARVDLTK